MKSDNHKYAGPERRYFVRIPFEAVIRYKVSKESKKGNSPALRDAKSKNISTSGILFKSRERFPLGTLLEMEFTVPTEEGYSEVQIVGKIMRVSEVGEFYDNGVAFYKIKRKDENAISNLVDFLEEADEEM